MQRFNFLAVLLIISLVFFAPVASAATNNFTIYEDNLASGWQNWSWGSAVNFDNPSPTISGTRSIYFDPGVWAALYLHTDNAINISSFKNFSFSLFTTSNSQKFAVIFYDSNNQMIGNSKNLTDFGGIPIQNSWKKYSIPVSAIGGTHIKGFAIQEISGQNQQNVFIDKIEFELPESNPVNNVGWEIFIDNLTAGWQNWSWGSNINFSSEISFTPSAWGALYLHSDTGVNTANLPYLTLNIRSTQNNQKLQVGFYDSNNQQTSNFKPLTNYGGEILTTWKTYSIPVAEFNASNKIIKGLAVQDAVGQNQQTVFIDNVKFINQNSTQNPQPNPTTTPTQSPVGNGYAVSNNKVLKNGSDIILNGISWFGFETETHAAHGLWSRNYKDIISQVKNLGFNSIRVPICPPVLKGVAPTSIDEAKNTDLKGLNSLQVLDKILNEMNNQGIYILLDHHRPDCNAISQLWYTGGYQESEWINDLKFMAQRYKNLSNFIGLDIKNEPHGQASWGTGNTGTDWNLAAQRAGKAVLEVNPNILIFIQGVQENSNCSSNIAHWMGGNFEPFNCSPISSASIPLNKLVLSPHVYGPDVYNQGYFSDPNFPNNMSSIWEKHFGFLVNKGLTVVPGEWGGKYGNGGDLKDKIWQDSFVNYLKSKKICSSYYWSLNPNSGDTGGILKDDWVSVWDNKMNLLRNYFNNCN